MAYLKVFDDWMDPEKKFLFFSINNFARYLGVPQKAIHNLVSSKHLDSVVREGRTFIPGSSQFITSRLLLMVRFTIITTRAQKAMMRSMQSGRRLQS